MAVPLDVDIYIKPNTLSNVTFWNGTTQIYPEGSGTISGEYIKYNIQTSSTVTLKADGYEDLTTQVIEGQDKYVTMTPVKNYISSITHKNTTYTIKDAEARIALEGKQDALPSQSGNDGKYLTTNGTTVSWATVQAGPKFLTFQNITASTWVSDNTYSEFSYKCVLTCTGVTSSDYAQVIFNPAQSVSGNYANVCLTDTDTITIYSKVNTAISIPTITVIGSN